MSSDKPAAYTVLGVYVVLVFALLPRDAYPLMLIGLATLIAGTIAADRVWGDRATHGMTVMVASVLGAAVLVLPNFPAMGGTHRAAVPLGFLGSQGVALLWVTIRWQPKPKNSERASLGECMMFGAIGALGLSAIATIPIGIILLKAAAQFSSVLWVYPAYFVGAAAAALFYWVLQGVSHRPVGRYVIGVFGGMCMYTAMVPVVSIVKNEPLSLVEFLTIGLILGALVGPPVAIETAEETS